MKSDEYVEDIEQTREDIDRTLNTLQEKLTPRELLDQAFRWSGGAREFSLNVGRTIRDNPIPATLMGISLIWLMAAGTGKRPPLDLSRERLNRKMQEIDPRLNM